MNKILNFLPYFGQRIENSPNILPAFGNYNQDIGPDGGNKIGNLTLLNGERMFDAAQNPVQPFSDFTFDWFIDGQYKTSNPTPNMSDLKGQFRGVLKIGLVITHKPTQTVYSRSYWGYFGYNDLPLHPQSDQRPGQFEVFSTPFYPDVEPYHFAKLANDLDLDGDVDAADLLKLLAQ